MAAGLEALGNTPLVRLRSFERPVGCDLSAEGVQAHRLAAELGPGRLVVTVLVDTGLKYLAGDLFADY